MWRAPLDDPPSRSRRRHPERQRPSGGAEPGAPGGGRRFQRQPDGLARRRQDVPDRAHGGRARFGAAPGGHRWRLGDQPRRRPGRRRRRPGGADQHRGSVPSRRRHGPARAGSARPIAAVVPGLVPNGRGPGSVVLLAAPRSGRHAGGGCAVSLTFAPEAGLRTGRRLRVRGLVQGVGFRPFIYNLALRLELDGWVRNTSSGVEIEVSGPASALGDFGDRLGRETPPLARIDQIEVEACHVAGEEGFRILTSLADADGFQLVPADVAACPACLSEVFDPANRRYRYPFTNCTHCGPRLTIIESMPYDRPGTTMAGFAMCPACSAEYHDPADRRFHAQPIACADCGPILWLEVGGERIAERDEALRAARLRLTQGQNLAVRGLGGFHLACDAADEAAVNRLRARKGRGDKPFAVMFADLAEVERAAIVGPAERQALQRRDRPIVVVERGAGAALAASLAPGQHTAGALLPYTPLPHLLLERADGFPTALVMTSGNRSEEPIAADLDEARRGLADIADGFLMHDRPIHQRCDDSVQRLFRGADLPLRRARGRVPDPIELPGAQRPLLAGGAGLEKKFCPARAG